jgi:spoIIIJ-associated protein
MKKYTEKTLEDCLAKASEELKVETKDLIYKIDEEKKGLFIKKTTITVYEESDVIEYAESYITDVCHSLGIEVSLKSIMSGDVIKVLIETNHNPLLIGKNGATLQALNELTKLAVSNKFKRRIRILLDVGDYKDKKYGRVISLAKRSAKEVLKTHIDVKLEPMTPDERKKVHNALSSWRNIKTESVGDGADRAIVVKYVVNPSATTTSSEDEVDISKEDTEPSDIASVESNVTKQGN